MTDVVADTLVAILAELREMNGRLAVRQPARLSRADQDALVAILPVVAEVVAHRVFTVRELREHALLPSQGALREAIERVGGANRLGRLLKRGDGVAVAGYTVDHVGQDRDGLMWRVRAVPDRIDRTDA